MKAARELQHELGDIPLLRVQFQTPVKQLYCLHQYPEGEGKACILMPHQKVGGKQKQSHDSLTVTKRQAGDGLVAVPPKLPILSCSGRIRGQLLSLISHDSDLWWPGPRGYPGGGAILHMLTSLTESQLPGEGHLCILFADEPVH